MSDRKDQDKGIIGGSGGNTSGTGGPGHSGVGEGAGAGAAGSGTEEGELKSAPAREGGERSSGRDEPEGLSAGETTTFETALVGGENEGRTAQVTVTATTVKVRELPTELSTQVEVLQRDLAQVRKQAAVVDRASFRHLGPRVEQILTMAEDGEKPA